MNVNRRKREDESEPNEKMNVNRSNEDDDEPQSLEDEGPDHSRFLSTHVPPQALLRYLKKS